MRLRLSTRAGLLVLGAALFSARPCRADCSVTTPASLPTTNPASAPALATMAALTAAPASTPTSASASASESAPASAPANPTFLERSTLAVGMGAEVHAADIPLDWSAGLETSLSPWFSVELYGFVTNGSRFRDRIDYVSVAALLLFHPLATLAERPDPAYLARVAAGFGLEAGPSLELTHVGPQFQTNGGLSLGLRMDIPLLADGSVAIRLAIRHFFAPTVTFPAPMGGVQAFDPPALETFAGLAFRL